MSHLGALERARQSPQHSRHPGDHIGVIIARPSSSSSAMASSASQAGGDMVVDSAPRGDGPVAEDATAGPEILEEEDILPLLVSAGTTYDAYSWTPEHGSLFEVRYAAVAPETMKTLSAKTRSHYQELWFLPHGVECGLPFLRDKDDLPLVNVVDSLAAIRGGRTLNSLPPIHMDYAPRDLPPLGLKDRGYLQPAVISERTFRSKLKVLTTADKGELKEISPRRRYFPMLPTWWKVSEVPRGMPARTLAWLPLRG